MPLDFLILWVFIGGIGDFQTATQHWIHGAFFAQSKGFEFFEGILWDQVSLHIEDDYYGNQVCNAIFGRQLFKTSGQLDKQNPKTNNIADSSAEEAYHIFSHIHWLISALFLKTSKILNNEKDNFSPR